MRVNYLKEIVTFERWAEENTLPTVAQLLWYKLMGRCNRLMWPEWFAIDNLRLMSMLHVSKETLKKAKKALVEAGRIEVRPGKKGSPSQYRIIPFSTSSVSKANFFVSNEAEKKGQKCPTLKNKKQIKKRDAVASPEKDNTGTAEKSVELVKDVEAVRDLYNQICKSFPHLDKLSWIQRRALKARMKEGRTVADFEKLFRNVESSDFLKGAGASGWKASLDWLLRRENMAKVLAGSYAVLYGAGMQEWKPKKNGFHNFEQRNTDYDAMTIQNVLSWLNT